MSPVKPSERLPVEGIYVLAHVSAGSVGWHDPTDPDGVYWRVAKLVREQPQPNNPSGLYWREWGPGRWFHGDVDLWCHLPGSEVR